MQPTASHYQQVISRWIDGGADPAALHELADALRESAEARRIYFSYMAIHAELDGATLGEEYAARLPSLPSGISQQIEPDASVSRMRFTWGAASAIAATVALMVGSWVLWGSGGDERRREVIRANVADVSPDCRWYVNAAGEKAGQSFRRGDVLHLASGKLLLRYEHGVDVTLQGPALYELASRTNASLTLGRATVQVAEGGKGFTVDSPRVSVIDLGTEFGIGVSSDGATDVLVFNGEVDVSFVAPTAGTTKPQRLRMGEGVRLDAAGTKSRIVSLDSQQYSPGVEVSEQQRNPVIASVTDNISRDSSLNFYEIVHGGMREDALAFVDRVAHQYNGVDHQGMPAYLLGGDYVKTFNNDKDFYDQTIQIEVTLAAPARLYVLLDTRIDPPRWLKENFRNTGDVVGLDNGPFYDPKSQVWHNKGPSGVGPGESVDDKLAIWVQEVPEPKKVSLGPLGARAQSSAESDEPTSPMGRNMYGIVATPAVETP